VRAAQQAVCEKTHMAVANNADLCAAVYQAHDLRFERDATALVCLGTPPPFYPKLMTLKQTAAAAQTASIQSLLADGQDAVAVKDSFANLDPDTLCMKLLFEASWLWRTPMSAQMPEGWEQVVTPADLSAWQAAWSGGELPNDQPIFPPACLANPDLIFLGCRSGSDYQAGCLANKSENVVGISNAFSTTANGGGFAPATQAVSAVAGGKPLVGYEHGEALESAQRAGFDPVGVLRVLVR